MPTTPPEPVKLNPGLLMRTRVISLEGHMEDDPWYSIGPAMWRASALDTGTRATMEKRVQKGTMSVSDFGPNAFKRGVLLKLIRKGRFKHDGVTYFIYRHRHIQRFVVAAYRPPKVLYALASAAVERPLLIADEPTLPANRMGRQRLGVDARGLSLQDDKDDYKATFICMPVALPQDAVDRIQVDLATAEAEEEFASTRASPDFRRWFEGASDVVRNDDGSPKVFFRGQRQGDGGLQSRLTLDSFTDSPDIASIYSTAAGVVGPGSNVIPVYIDAKNPLVIPYASISWYDFLSYMGYWDGTGMDHDESLKVLNYLSKRNKAAEYGNSMFGGVPKKLKSFAGLPSFKWQVRDEPEDEGTYDEDAGDVRIEWDDEVLGPGLLSRFREAWEDVTGDDPSYSQRLALLLAVDTFALVETPAALRAMTKLGYDAVWHKDTFEAQTAAESLLNKDIEDIQGIEEGEEDYTWDEMSYRYAHMTLRPLSRKQVWPLLADRAIAAKLMAKEMLTQQEADKHRQDTGRCPPDLRSFRQTKSERKT